MKKNFSKKIIPRITTLMSAFSQNFKFTETNTREYAVRGRFYYFPEF